MGTTISRALPSQALRFIGKQVALQKLVNTLQALQNSMPSNSDFVIDADAVIVRLYQNRYSVRYLDTFPNKYREQIDERVDSEMLNSFARVLIDSIEDGFFDKPDETKTILIRIGREWFKIDLTGEDAYFLKPDEKHEDKIEFSKVRMAKTLLQTQGVEAVTERLLHIVQEVLEKAPLSSTLFIDLLNDNPQEFDTRKRVFLTITKTSEFAFKLLVEYTKKAAPATDEEKRIFKLMNADADVSDKYLDFIELVFEMPQLRYVVDLILHFIQEGIISSMRLYFRRNKSEFSVLFFGKKAYQLLPVRETLKEVYSDLVIKTKDVSPYVFKEHVSAEPSPSAGVYFLVDQRDPHMLAKPTSKKYTVQIRDSEKTRRMWAVGTVDDFTLADMGSMPNVVDHYHGDNTKVMYWLRDKSTYAVRAKGAPNRIEERTLVDGSKVKQSMRLYGQVGKGVFIKDDLPNLLSDDGFHKKAQWVSGSEDAGYKLRQRAHLPSSVSKIKNIETAREHVFMGRAVTRNPHRQSACTQYARMQYSFGTCASTSLLNLVLTNTALTALAMMQVNSIFSAAPTKRAEWNDKKLQYSIADDPRELFLRIVYDHVCISRKSLLNVTSGATCLHFALKSFEGMIFEETLEILSFTGLQLQVINLSVYAEEVDALLVRHKDFNKYPRKLVQVLQIDDSDPDKAPERVTKDGCVLIGAHIEMLANKHAIAAIICNDGSRVMFDANFGEVSIDWTQPYQTVLPQLSDYAEEQYGKSEHGFVGSYFYVPRDTLDAVRDMEKTAYMCDGAVTADAFGTPYIHCKRDEERGLGAMQFAQVL